MRNVSGRRTSKYKFCLQKVISEIFAVYEIMWMGTGEGCTGFWWGI